MSDDDALHAFVAALPKVELHLHLEGSVRPATLLTLAERHGTDDLPRTLDELRDLYVFRDFDRFITVYLAICNQLRTEDDFALVVAELGETLARQNVAYAEVTFTPFNHTRRGVAPEVVFDGVEEGRRIAERDHGVQLAFVCDIPGELGGDGGARTADLVLEHRTPAVVGFGLGGPEVGFPRPLFADAFARARAAGLRSLPHAGETAGPRSVWDALDVLGAERIGHGVRSIEDPELVARLATDGVPLEVCPTSNLRLGVVDDLADHPLPRLMAAGVTCTLNTDDPPMFDTTLHDEYVTAVTEIGLDVEDLRVLAANGVRASYLGAARKRELLAEIAAVPAPGVSPSANAPSGRT